jgi:hypothetical protein
MLAKGSIEFLLDFLKVIITVICLLLPLTVKPALEVAYEAVLAECWACAY